MFIHKEITLKKLYLLCRDSAILTAQVMVLVSSAAAFSWVLTTLQAPQILSMFLAENFTSIWSFLLFLNLILLIIGMFIDATTATLVIAPLIFAPAVALGIDPLHIGIVMVTNLAIGMFTPPFGLNIFVASSVTGASIVEIIPGVLKFLVVALVALLILTFFPIFSTFLPELLY